MGCAGGDQILRAPAVPVKGRERKPRLEPAVGSGDLCGPSSLPSETLLHRALTQGCAGLTLPLLLFGCGPSVPGPSNPAPSGTTAGITAGDLRTRLYAFADD